jgi:hypothetical protein
MEEKLDPKPVYFVNPSTIIGSTYAQIVSVTCSSDGILTLDFVFKHPRDANEGQVVTRVSIPKSIGLELSDIIKKVIENYDEKIKNGKAKNDTKKS